MTDIIPNIQISVCTYKRPNMLKTCIESVAQLNFPEEAYATLLIIDNDSNQTAKKIVAEYQNSFPIPINCCYAPRQGIPMARNRAIDFAMESGSDYLIFIDDDERVQRNWLTELYTYARGIGGNHIIQGAVKSELPPDTPQYIAHCFHKKYRPTGSLLKFGVTNNVLIPLPLIRDLNLRFDEKLAFTGSSDTAFFMKAMRKGAKIYACAEAVVCETIPDSRLSIAWLSKRSYRYGLLSVKIGKIQNRRPAALLLKTLGQLISKLIRCIFLLLQGKRIKAMRAWRSVCKQTGICAGILGLKFEEYRHTHGH